MKKFTDKEIEKLANKYTDTTYNGYWGVYSWL